MYYFPRRRMQGDIDNIVKLVLDALARYVYVDDRQVERLVVQKFEPGNMFGFAEPSEAMASALFAGEPALYLRISDEPFEELR